MHHRCGPAKGLSREFSPKQESLPRQTALCESELLYQPDLTLARICLSGLAERLESRRRFPNAQCEDATARRLTDPCTGVERIGYGGDYLKVSEGLSSAVAPTDA